MVFARIAGESDFGGIYSSGVAEVTNGMYSSLNIGPPSIRYSGLDIYFFAIVDDSEVIAAETLQFKERPIDQIFDTLDLTFEAP